MDIVLTYFVNRLSDDDLATLLRRREDFYLENITAMDVLTTRMQKLLAADGLSSLVQVTPGIGISWDPIHGDLIVTAIYLLCLLWMLLRLAAQRLARPRCDVILRVTSNAALRVRFQPSARRPAA